MDSVGERHSGGGRDWPDLCDGFAGYAMAGQDTSKRPTAPPFALHKCPSRTLPSATRTSPPVPARRSQCDRSVIHGLEPPQSLLKTTRAEHCNGGDKMSA